jgi:hypothetical protein
LKALIAAAIAVALSAAPSSASQTQVLSDCYQHATLTHTYTLSDLRGALATMPTAMKAYGPCADVIERALLTARGLGTNSQGNSGGGSGSSFLPTPVIIILIALALATAGYTVMAVRGRGEGAGDGEPPGSD